MGILTGAIAGSQPGMLEKQYLDVLQRFYNSCLMTKGGSKYDFMS